MLVAAESASRVAGPAPAVKDGVGSLDRAEGLDAGADGSGQRVGDEVARADQERATLLRFVPAPGGGGGDVGGARGPGGGKGGPPRRAHSGGAGRAAKNREGARGPPPARRRRRQRLDPPPRP